MMKTNTKKEFRKAFTLAFPSTIPVLTGFLVIGMTYGILMQTKGYGIIWSMLMSGIAFCGSMQFVAITLLTVAFDPIQAFCLSLMVNARHIFYGISMLQKYQGLGKSKIFLIYTLCDETFSISSSATVPKEVNRKFFYLSISLLNYFYWVLGTFIGSVLGNFIHFNTTGLDFVLTALFVVLFLEQWKRIENRVSAMIGIISATISLFLFGQNHLVIPAMILILATLLMGRKKLCI